MRFTDLANQTLAEHPSAPTTPTEALHHTIAFGAGQADDDMAVTVTNGVYSPGVRTGLTWGDLRALAALLDAEPEQPSPDHMAVYLDQHGQVYCDYPTMPPGDDVVPLVYAAEVAKSRADLAEQGSDLRVIGWCQ